MTATEITLKMERMRKRIVCLTNDFRKLEAELAQTNCGDQLYMTSPTDAPATEPAMEAAMKPAMKPAMEPAMTKEETKEEERKETEERKGPKKEEKENKEKESIEGNDIYTRGAIFSKNDGSMSMEERRQLFTQRVEEATPQWTPEARHRFCAFWSKLHPANDRRMLFESRSFDLTAKLATWVDYSQTSGLAMARARQLEEARQRSIEAQDERERRSQERDERLSQQAQAFVPLPVLQAYTAAGFGDYRQTDKAAIITTLRRHGETPGAAPLPQVLAQWLAQEVGRKRG